MKKNYIAPMVKVRRIDTDPMMTASTITLTSDPESKPTVSNGGVWLDSKKGIFDSDESSSSSSSIWDNE